MKHKEDEIKLKSELELTKQRMRQEIERLNHSEQVMSESNNALQSTNSIYNIYNNKLNLNMSKFHKIRRSSEQDTYLLWFSFFFLLFTCCFIILRRLGFIRYLIFKPIIIIMKLFRDNEFNIKEEL
ncbi:hypothetical protein cand_024060 [Cryptosporidium andersoni]|uniref:Sec20 C-terminal domain-containing protein n=1 Tax=Cryptosporidium andersoni TaxID=117008 RepID=A0A1J4MRY3_9CRYT|nr:hypothetical protein cand_024060 [Cryptosporidium andersoni]